MNESYSFAHQLTRSQHTVCVCVCVCVCVHARVPAHEFACVVQSKFANLCLSCLLHPVVHCTNCHSFLSSTPVASSSPSPSAPPPTVGGSPSPPPQVVLQSQKGDVMQASQCG